MTPGSTSPSPGREGSPAIRVSVLVVNYMSGPYLADSLRSLAAQTMPAFEVIVVDNGSTDGSFEAARAAVAGDERFRFDAAGRNLGFAAGNNRAAAQARAPWLACLNPDAFAAPDWLERLLAATERHPDAAMLGSTQLDATDGARLDGVGDEYFFAGLPWRSGYGWPSADLPRGDRAVFGPCAAAALYRRDAFEAVGGFDERHFCYVEDVDLAFRLRLRGHIGIQVAEAVVRHVGGASSGGARSRFANFHGTRNVVWCFVKNMPGPLFWPLLPFHAAAMLAFLARGLLIGHQGVAAGLGAALTALPWRQRAAIQAERTVGWTSIARAVTWNPLVYLRRAWPDRRGSSERPAAGFKP